MYRFFRHVAKKYSHFPTATFNCFAKRLVPLNFSTCSNHRILPRVIPENLTLYAKGKGGGRKNTCTVKTNCRNVLENKKLHITKKLLHYKNLQQNCVAKNTKDFLPFIAKSTLLCFPKNRLVTQKICKKVFETVCKNKKLYVIQKTLHYKNLRQNSVAKDTKYI